MVKKPRANRSAAPRKPVIIEAEAKPVETGKAEPAKAAETPPAGAKPDAKPMAEKTTAVASKAQTTPNVTRKDVTTSGTTPPAKAEETSLSAKTNAPKKDDTKKTTSDKPSPKASSGPSDNGSNGGGSSVKGGVIGAALALLGAIGLNYAGILPGGGSDNSADISSLEAKVEALSNSTATAAPEFDPNSVQPLIDAALAEQSTTLQAEIDALTAKLGEAQNNDASSESNAQIAALEQQVADLQSALSSGSAGENEGMSVLANRVEAIEGGLNTLQQNVSSMGESVQATIPEEVTQTLTDVQEKIAQNAETLGTLTTALSSTKEEAMSAISALSEDVSGKISGLSEEVTTLSEKAADTSRQTDVASAIATAGLKAAIDRGGPFMAELETYAQVNPESNILDQLRPLAAKGVPTQSDLLKQFDSAAYDMIAAADAPADGEGGMLSGLMSSAKSLVKVRPVGNVEGDSVGAITARIGEALNASNYAGVQAEFASLPETAKAAGAGFINSVEARQQADALIQNVLNQALQTSAPQSAN